MPGILEAPRVRREPGTVYTFYSYKGGVGRSMALANAAALLARWGHRCLLVDWDLEAPGIEKYFEPYAPKLAAASGKIPGMVDLIVALQEREPLDWRRCLHKVRLQSVDTHLAILPAGRRTPSYNQTVQSLDFQRLFDEHDLGNFLEGLREEWIAEYDFVLVDSRTGISDIGGICTVLLPDVLVLLFGTNHQSLEGVAEVMEGARAARRQLPLDRANLVAVPVPSRDESETAPRETDEWRDRFAARLGNLYGDWLPRDLEPRAALDQLYIPYVAVWSFGERLPVVEKPKEIRDPRSLSAAYGKLATLMAHGLDWRALESGALDVAESRAEAARHREKARSTSRASRWIAAASVLITVVSLLLTLWFNSRSQEGAQASRLLTLAAGELQKHPLNANLLAAELGDRPGSEEDLRLLRRILETPVPRAVFQVPSSIPGETVRIEHAEFRNGGELVATSSTDGAVRLWYADGSGQPSHPLRDDSVIAEFVRLMPDGRDLLSVSGDGAAQLTPWWDSDTVRELDMGVGPVLSPDRRWFLSTNDQSDAFVAPLSPEGQRHPLGVIGKAAFSPDGRWLATTAFGINLWELPSSKATPRSVSFFRTPSKDAFGSVAFCGAKMLAATTGRGEIYTWDLATGKGLVVSSRTIPFSQSLLACAPDASFLASMQVKSSEILMWELGAGRPADLPSHIFPNFPSGVTSLQFSPDGERLLVGPRGDSAWLLPVREDDSSSMRLSGIYGDFQEATFSPDGSPDGSSVLVVSNFGIATLWSTLHEPVSEEATWKELVERARQRTTACLDRDDRQVLLLEDADVAEEKAAACERRNGRGGTARRPSVAFLEENRERLTRMKIDIYFLEGQDGERERAEELGQQLRTLGLTRDIVVTGRGRSFFQRVSLPEGDEIRYLPGEEDEEAYLLRSALAALAPPFGIGLRESITRNPGTMSIHLWRRK